MKTYLDSSFVVSLYSTDVNTPAATGVLQSGSGAVLLLSDLAEVEVLNALELRVFRKEITRKQADESRSDFLRDVDGTLFVAVGFSSRVFEQAGKLALQSSSLLGCRTADVLHVAAALEAGAERLLTFDERQKELARKAKLKTN